MKKAFFHVMMLTALLACARASNAALLSVQSATDSNGLFTYTVQRGNEPYLWGGSEHLPSLTLPALGVLSVTTPPGWTAMATGATAITWSHTGTGTWFLDSTPIVFTLQSAFTLPVAYDSLTSTALYQQGTVFGDVYTTNLALYTGAASNETTSVNVVGYERFAFMGPALPEPLTACVLVVGAAWCRRHRLRRY
jgi:hypothetical protein